MPPSSTNRVTFNVALVDQLRRGGSYQEQAIEKLKILANEEGQVDLLLKFPEIISELGKAMQKGSSRAMSSAAGCLRQVNANACEMSIFFLIAVEQLALNERMAEIIAGDPDALRGLSLLICSGLILYRIVPLLIVYNDSMITMMITA